ncbi:MAG: enoyl-ACP reductase [Planctomycetes bacterium]|jgi:enoyl-[acyl-carrier protein] reductase I|nr:enoyl-ACP reductase [Planctomycetota bacterium]MBT4029290.1 enoyl-ACP reductase [Planctomycetota bacterium]MBT4561275.1 enoyl-ACP reductase [Planctomycetota bacterium]MBT5101661.1 enoyl-ACP reductase [Planctomycetota bacterium]MBT7012426.1 enoyl-ACP reductase [Planctomycetota bacterium]
MLKGKKGVILGVANKRSLAWFIAEQCAAHGAEMIWCVANERFKQKAMPLAESLGVPEPIICDVSDDASIDEAFAKIKQVMPQIDFLVHAVAFANREDLEGRFVDTSRDGYAMAQNISSYSLTAVTKAAEPMMVDGSSVLTLTYIGSLRAVPNYNVMGVAKAALESSVRYLANDLGGQGIRVNAISAGPIKTLSSAGVKGLREKLDLQEEKNSLQRNIVGEDVGKAAVFMLSNYSAAVTGEILYVDNGYHSCAATWA